MSDLSEEIKAQLQNVKCALTDVQSFFAAVDQIDYDNVVTSNLSPVDRAKYDLTILYAINSLFWMVVRSYGIDPQSHGIREEMERIKEQMTNLKHVTDKEKMPRVDKAAAKRIVSHELSANKRLGKKKMLDPVDVENWENEMKDKDEPGEEKKN